MELANSSLRPFIDFVRLCIESAGAFWIVFGAGQALLKLIRAHLRFQTETFTPIRLQFSRYLSLALEFQLASDILETALAPTWEEIGELAIIAAIRTALNFFLSREIKEYREKCVETPVLLEPASAHD